MFFLLQNFRENSKSIQESVFSLENELKLAYNSSWRIILKKFIIFLHLFYSIGRCAVLYNEGIPFRSSFYSLNAFKNGGTRHADSIPQPVNEPVGLSIASYRVRASGFRSGQRYIYFLQAAYRQHQHRTKHRLQSGQNDRRQQHDDCRVRQNDVPALPNRADDAAGHQHYDARRDENRVGIRRLLPTAFSPFSTAEQAKRCNTIPGVKTRGGTSKLFYSEKELHCKIHRRSHRKDESHSVLGMTENSRFALNSLYEDESKISLYCDAGIWEKMENTQGMKPRLLD